MPRDTHPGMAFVLVQHLAPDHKTMLRDLVQKYTTLPVLEVEDGMAVQPNTVYIIPPGYDMALLHGTLQLLEPTAPRGQRLPIDYFFTSLAQNQGERAIGIVLSGTGNDGAAGVRAIKAAGGMVVVQDPAHTEFDGMPRAAIATGLADAILPVAQMVPKLVAYATHAFGKLPWPSSAASPQDENSLKKVCVLLRAQTGHDFSQYKPATIHRRIERRMAVHQISGFETYVQYLQKAPEEVQALFADLLIGVTHFFRDPDAFAQLQEHVIPKLFANKSPGTAVRVWCTGCSSGEEAYSVAILLQEHMEALKVNYTLQVFATDIDARAVASARVGVYPASIAAHVSAQRLRRFFTAEPGGQAYRIHKGIRDILIFSEQNLIKDPPFSKLDLLCCRNLLIYLGTELQKRLMPMFHYALNPGGHLFLGTSEGVGEFSELFATVDRKAKLYQRKDDFTGAQRAALSRALASTLPPMTEPFSASAAKGVHANLPGTSLQTPATPKVSLREIAEHALLQQVAPASALVNAGGDILYLHGRTGMYLELSSGEAGINNMLKMAREGLRPGLAIALQRVVSTGQPERAQGLRVKTNGHCTMVDLSVRAVLPTRETHPPAGPTTPLYLVTLEEAANQSLAQPTSASTPDAAINLDTDARIAALKDELRARDEYLQNTREELESSSEELKSSNEEMQSVNEELQSTNEELETSKEELQSVNEELATVNTELHTKVADLSRLNNDMNNLLSGTGVATVFVDRQLRILRFTPMAARLINLIPGDVGRPVGHIVSNLVGYDRLVADARAVLDTLAPLDIQVQSTDGAWFTMRIRPYRTLDNVIEGVVITFSDITALKAAEDALAAANSLARLAAVVRDAHDAITVQDLGGRILAWNPGAVRMYGWSEAQALQLNARQRIPPELQNETLAKLLALSRAEVLEPYRTQRLTQSGQLLDVWMTATALLDEAGHLYAIATTERAITAGTTVAKSQP
jgi:two-component system, chemotaxis family, CheB/CheR fusion protein